MICSLPSAALSLDTCQRQTIISLLFHVFFCLSSPNLPFWSLLDIRFWKLSQNVNYKEFVALCWLPSTLSWFIHSFNFFKLINYIYFILVYTQILSNYPDSVQVNWSMQVNVLMMYIRTEKSLTRLTGNIPLNNASAVTQAVICFSCIKLHLFLCVCVSRRLVVTSLRSQMRWSWLASPSWASPDSISLAQQRERERTPLLHSNSHLLLPFRLSFPPPNHLPSSVNVCTCSIKHSALIQTHTNTHSPSFPDAVCLSPKHSSSHFPEFKAGAHHLRRQ